MSPYRFGKYGIDDLWRYNAVLIIGDQNGIALVEQRARSVNHACLDGRVHITRVDPVYSDDLLLDFLRSLGEYTGLCRRGTPGVDYQSLAADSCTIQRPPQTAAHFVVTDNSYNRSSGSETAYVVGSVSGAARPDKGAGMMQDENRRFPRNASRAADDVFVSDH